MTLPGALCACGEAELFSVKPGTEPLRRGAVDLFTRLDPLIDGGVADQFWCRACWMAKFGGAK